MDLAFTSEDLAFQAEVRAWIAENYTPGLRAKMALSKNGYLDKEGQVEWQKKLAARGWAAPDWPVEHGGPGWTSSQRYIFNMEVSAAGCPSPPPMGLKMVGPVIMAFGNDKQKAQHLPKILTSDIWWCQGYSEPGSGSDLASLQMKAEKTVRDGVEGYVLNGSKIWTPSPMGRLDVQLWCVPAKKPKPKNGISFNSGRHDHTGQLACAPCQLWMARLKASKRSIRSSMKTCLCPQKT